MNLPVPILLLLAPLVAAGVLSLLGRWRRLLAVVGVLLAGWLGWWIMTASLIANEHMLFAGDTWVILGRPLVLSESEQLLLGVLYGGVALLCFVSLWMPDEQLVILPAFLALSPLAAMLMSQFVLYGVLALAVAMLFLIVGLRTEQPTWVSAALRYGLLVVLILPFFLLVAWIVDGEQASLFGLASRFFWLSMLLLWASFPVQFWIVVVSGEASPLAMSFVLGLAQLPIMAFLFEFLAANLWLYSNEPLLQFVRWVGVLTIVVAGGGTLIVAGERKRLLGYLVSLDMGIMLLMLTWFGGAGGTTAVFLPLIRFGGLLVSGIGLWVLQQSRLYRVGLGLWVYGIMLLIGLPLTAGFAWRRDILTAVAQESPLMALAIIIALFSSCYGLLKAEMSTFSPPFEVG